MLLTWCKTDKVSGKFLSEAMGDWVGCQAGMPEEYMTQKRWEWTIRSLVLAMHAVVCKKERKYT